MTRKVQSQNVHSKTSKIYKYVSFPANNLIQCNKHCSYFSRTASISVVTPKKRKITISSRRVYSSFTARKLNPNRKPNFKSLFNLSVSPLVFPMSTSFQFVSRTLSHDQVRREHFPPSLHSCVSPGQLFKRYPTISICSRACVQHARRLVLLDVLTGRI